MSGSVRLQMAKADQRFGQRDGSDQNFDYMFKLLIIGNSSVGKTSFLFRYADDSFSNSFVSTVGIDFKVKTVYRNDKRVKLQIWVSPSGSCVHVFICRCPLVCVYEFILMPYISVCTLLSEKVVFVSCTKITNTVWIHTLSVNRWYIMVSHRISTSGQILLSGHFGARSILSTHRCVLCPQHP